MIFGKMWRAFRAQLNKLANFFWTADPIAQMQYEYDQAVEELKSGLGEHLPIWMSGEVQGQRAEQDCDDSAVERMWRRPGNQVSLDELMHLAVLRQRGELLDGHQRRCSHGNLKIPQESANRHGSPPASLS